MYDGRVAWSVLTDGEASVSPEVRAAVAALDENAIGHEVGRRVLKKLAADIHPWFSAGVHDWADVDVYAAEMRGETLVLRFIADHYNYNFAQSGSDWADHYLFDGEIHVVDGKRRRETFEQVRHVHLTERESDEYSIRETFEAVRRERRALHAASIVDPQARPEAHRCPQCGSDSIRVELLFDAYRLECVDCRFAETFETYPERDDDARWRA